MTETPATISSIQSADRGLMEFQMTSKPWEKRPDESARAFGAFCIYRDMGPQRSLVKVAEQLSETGRGKGNATGRLKEWSRQFEWVYRAAEYDKYYDELELEELARERKQMAKAKLEIARKMQEAVLARITTLKPEDIPITQVPRWAETATKIEEPAREGIEKYAQEQRARDSKNSDDMIELLESDPELRNLYMDFAFRFEDKIRELRAKREDAAHRL